MLRSCLIYLLVLAFLSLFSSSCFLKKNKCDTCPSFNKHRHR